MWLNQVVRLLNKTKNKNNKKQQEREGVRGKKEIGRKKWINSTRDDTELEIVK